MPAPVVVVALRAGRVELTLPALENLASSGDDRRFSGPSDTAMFCPFD